MTNSDWFDDIPTIGTLSLDEAAIKLREIGENDDALLLEKAIQDGIVRGMPLPNSQRIWPFKDKLWQHTSHAFGFIEPITSINGFVPIKNAGNINADTSLKNNRIKITLDRLRVADYPGRGLHQILFDFYAQNQVPNAVEHLHFNATFRAQEGEHVAIIGYPLFVGLNVGNEGVTFKCFTVNVKNDSDIKMLNFLESDVFKSGLKLATTLQPAIALVSGMAIGLTKSVATKTKNVPVQDFHMGLDFSNIPMRARLAVGSYIAVQIPDKYKSTWKWSKWIYSADTGQIVEKANHKHLLPYNYIVFSISPYDE